MRDPIKCQKAVHQVIAINHLVGTVHYIFISKAYRVRVILSSWIQGGSVAIIPIGCEVN